MACITYSVTTHESAENGEHAEHGWWLPGGWEHALETVHGHNDDVLAEAKAGEFDLPLKEAIEHALDLGCTQGEAHLTSLSVSSVDPPCDRAFLEDGESRHYTLHVDNLTPLRMRLVKSYLKSKGVTFS